MVDWVQELAARWHSSVPRFDRQRSWDSRFRLFSSSSGQQILAPQYHTYYYYYYLSLLLLLLLLLWHLNRPMVRPFFFLLGFHYSMIVINVVMVLEMCEWAFWPFDRCWHAEKWNVEEWQREGEKLKAEGGVKRVEIGRRMRVRNEGVV